MKKEIGPWCIVLLYDIEQIIQNVHKEDIQLAKKYLRTAAVFKHVSELDGYQLVEYVDIRLRVKMELLRSVDAPIASIGQMVRVLSGSAQGKSAEVCHLTWHFNKQKIIYTLKVEEKILSREYFAEDICPL